MILVLDKLYNVFLNNNDNENTYNMNTLLEFYYNMKLNGYYSTLEYYKFADLPKNILKMLYNDFKNQNYDKIAGKLKKYCAVYPKGFIKHNNYGLIQLDNQDVMKTTFTNIKNIFDKIKITLIEDKKIKSDGNNILSILEEKIPIDGKSSYIFLTDIYEPNNRNVLYKQNTPYNIDVSNNITNLNRLSKNPKRSYVIVLNQNSDLQFLNELEINHLLNIATITNTDFLQDYLAPIIHYKYNQQDKNIVNNFYNNINKNIFESFLPNLKNDDKIKLKPFYLKLVDSRTNHNIYNTIKLQLLNINDKSVTSITSDNFIKSLLSDSKKNIEISLIYKIKSKYYTYLIGNFKEEGQNIYFYAKPNNKLTKYGLHKNNLLHNQEINLNDVTILKLDSSNNSIIDNSQILSYQKNDLSQDPIPLQFYLTKNLVMEQIIILFIIVILIIIKDAY